MMLTGNLLKMDTTLDVPVKYALNIMGARVEMNSLIGKELTINYLGKIHCICCGKVTRKSFGQGYCYPCFISVPETSECVLRPEKCLAHEGISRDMEWSASHCLQDQVVYLALSSAIKVGVTRASQVPTRWIDQGAWKAIVLARVPNRFLAGSIEVYLKKYLSDKTNWRHMLTGKVDESIHLEDEKARVARLLPIEWYFFLELDNSITEIVYPVLKYPEKVQSVDLEKKPKLQGRLMGVKGQSLIFESGEVINIRKHNGYLVEIEF
jgi:hypothetical protein